MDVPVRSHRSTGRETSPDRAKICRLKQQKVKEAAVSVRKVQVVYYLSRNGLLEHPHFMEITLSANQPLRLKDVFNRLMALRGSGMPSQYSWSSKRNYKSGYVWCDLALMDIIVPSEGGEYVLKGSELVEAGCSSERFQHLNVSNKQANHTSGFNNTHSSSKSKAIFVNNNNNNRRGQEKEVEDEEYEDEEEEEYEEEQVEKLEYELDGEKTSYTSSTTTPHSRCSRGVSTEELDDELQQDAQNIKTKVKKRSTSPDPHCQGHAPPPPVVPTTTSSSLAEKLNEKERVKLNSNYPKRMFGNIGVGESSSVTTTTTAPPSRYSVLLQLIACGSSGPEFKAKHQQQEAAERSRLSNVGTTTITNTTTKQRETVDHQIQKKKPYSNHHHQISGDGDDEIENMMMMINSSVSENNPRMRMLGGKNLQYSCEEKEYFSGSIVDSMKANLGEVAIEEAEQTLVPLKRSNSYNELERRSRIGMMEEVKRKEILEQEKRETRGGGGGVKDKCIPLRKSSKETRK